MATTKKAETKKKTQPAQAKSKKPAPAKKAAKRAESKLSRSVKPAESKATKPRKAASADEGFLGFLDDGKFWKALAKNQNREWFAKHKTEFEDGWNKPMKALLQDVHASIDAAYQHCDLDAPKVFRIFRDVRFSKDKSPYKTHIAGMIPVKRNANVMETPVALYFHVGEETTVASGLYMMDGPVLARYRAAIVDDARGKELIRILGKLEQAGFGTGSMHHDVLKKVPKGFDPEHPRAELLKRKGLGVSFPAPPKALLTSPKLVGWLADHAKKAIPLVEWLVFATA
jgi:uncharacterized protein (TIGR02453 family)